MNTENVKQQMRKGALELCVLATLANKSGYPLGIKKELELVGLDVVEGTLYPLMTRLKNSGHLSYTWEESKEGPPQKTYALTESGRTYFEDMRNSWNEFVGSVDKIINNEIEIGD
jgi:PadR family transcriptional regulator, regulatory protein PadR